MYDSNDKSDFGALAHVTAYEIRLKMKSRQVIQMASVDPNTPFSVDENSDSCRLINEAAYRWGLERVSEKARKRFEAFGQKMVFAKDDTPKLPIGPLFIVGSILY
jgi:hypothetical protein